MLRGLVISQIVRYWNQNSLLSDFCVFTSLLYQRLKCQGYLHHELQPAFMEAAQRIDHTNGTSANATKDKLPSATALFHITYHLSGLRNHKIQQIFKAHCNFGTGTGSRGHINPYQSASGYAQHLGMDCLLIARSRSKNLHDLLCPSTLYQVPGREVSTFLH